jgi:chemotaxis response regulator CheB
MARAQENMGEHTNGNELSGTQMAMNFPVVCVGGSAVEMDAYTELLGSLPIDLGIAIVIIDNLNTVPDLLRDTLPKCTKIPIEWITDGLTVAPDRVFILPPFGDLHVRDGKFRIRPKSKPTGWPDVITIFLRSLSANWSGKLVAVILAGYDGDGAAALRDVKEVVGVTIAQRVDTARQTDMPLTAIASGYIDLVLPIEDIAKEIIRIARAVSRDEVHPPVGV